MIRDSVDCYVQEMEPSFIQLTGDGLDLQFVRSICLTHDPAVHYGSLAWPMTGFWT